MSVAERDKTSWEKVAEAEPTWTPAVKYKEVVPDQPVRVLLAFRQESEIQIDGTLEVYNALEREL